MEIVYLADHLHQMPTLAVWHDDQWDKQKNKSSLKMRQESFLQKANHCQIPTTLIAIERREAGGEIVLGSSCLVENILKSRPDLTP